MRVLHVTTGLGRGGAETMLLKLLSQTRHRSMVVSLMGDEGPIGDAIRNLGISVVGLGMSRGAVNPRSFTALLRAIADFAPDVVQTWMYHADLIGGIAAAAKRLPVVWNIRQSRFDPRTAKRTTVMTAQTCALLSRWLPRRIICNAEAGYLEHIRLGYYEPKMMVIPNGFDLEHFRPRVGAREAVRRSLGLADDVPIVGLIARFDAEKDHVTFIEAAARLRSAIPDVQFLLSGREITWQNASITKWIDRDGLGECFHLLGHREDVHALFAAMDVASLCSIQEGFPNVVGEAMACGVPCVVTDAGDSSAIVGDTGVVVPVGNPDALATGWKKLLMLDRPARKELGMRARARIQERYSLAAVAERYDDLYDSISEEACAD